MPQETEKMYELLNVAPPHQKGQLTTRLGRLIDGASYADLLLVAALAMGASSVYFYLATPYCQGIIYSNGGAKAESYFDALYFSAVTFTTLGYGDIVPIGIGRGVAALDVLAGLSLFSLLIGKIASERQYSMLLLLHTSDCQRRLQGFCDNLLVARNNLNLAHDARNVLAVNLATKHIANLMQAIFNYVVFHLNQSRLGEYG